MPVDVEALATEVVLLVKSALTPVTERLAAAEARLAALADLPKDVVTLRERAAVLETRAPVPGPIGPAGKDGCDGADGVGFEDLGVVQRDDRSFTITATHGDCVKQIGTAHVPLDIYRGIWADGRTYEPGDGVTWAGSEWHCHATTTTKPGDGSKAWTLKVKRGRDGKDGKDGPPGPPGKPGADWQQVYDRNRQ